MRTQQASGVSAEALGETYALSPADLLRVAWRRLWAILLVAGLCVVAAVGFSLAQTPVYEGSIKLLVGQEQGGDGPSNLGSDVQGLQQLTQTVAEAVNTRPVAEAVIQRLNLRMTSEEFLENLNVEQVVNTQFIEVGYEDPDPERAQRIANAVGEEFSEQVSRVSPSANAITATVWERAAVPEVPVSPDPVRNGLLALMVGGMMGLGLAFLLEYLDDSWRDPDEVERVSRVPTFGVIPEFRPVSEGKKKGGS